jgi:para-nitrobenzyl esterase
LGLSVGFNPCGIDDLITEFANRNRIPRSRARQIIAAHDVDGRTPVEARGALLTDYSFTLPQARGAPAHAAEALETFKRIDRP